MRRWCLWCGVVLAREADGTACAPCAAAKRRQIDDLVRRAMKAWRPHPRRGDVKEGTDGDGI
jgi:hypothetical protein